MAVVDHVCFYSFTGRVSLIGSSELIAEIPDTPRRKFTIAPAKIEQVSIDSHQFLS
jgi:hypothetical protein